MVPAVLLAVVGAGLELEEGFAAWSRWSYALFFLFGFAVAAQPAVLAAMRRLRGSAAFLGEALWIASFALYSIADRDGVDPLTSYDGVSTLFRATFGVTGWVWLVAILGFAQRPVREAPSTGEGAGEPVGATGSVGERGRVAAVRDPPARDRGDRLHRRGMDGTIVREVHRDRGGVLRDLRGSVRVVDPPVPPDTVPVRDDVGENARRTARSGPLDLRRARS